MNDRLLLRFIERKCTPEETRKVYRWINASEKNRKHYVQMQTVWSALEIEKASQESLTNESQIQQILSVVGKEKEKSNENIFCMLQPVLQSVFLFQFNCLSVMKKKYK